LAETCSRKFGDQDHLESNTTRAFGLWARTKLDEEGVLREARRAREVSKERISRSAIQDRGERMPYLFSVFEDLLGLRDSARAPRGGPG